MINNPSSPSLDSIVLGKKLRCIVIDDEPIARRGMALLASRNPSLMVMSVFSNPHEALEWLKSNAIDLIFLDIEMPGILGIDLAAQLSSETMIIFTTAFSEYAVRSYDLDAIDYLLKPISEERFNRAVQKALIRAGIPSDKKTLYPSTTLTLRAERRFINIDTDDIIFIEGVKDYVRIHSNSERIISRITIKTLLQNLPSDRFLRIHKSHIINITHIESYDTSSVVLHYGANNSLRIELPIGASYRQTIIPILKAAMPPL
ncbi:MAG: response regulator transcription factor [Muribaculaceae bacterium]|nr:response regulator transcription factor [Muribaculaceae bacterium]